MKQKKGIRCVRTPVVFQMEAAECGAACLLMILRYYGCHVPLEEVRIACGVSRNGCDAAGIVTAAWGYGMKSSGYRCPIEKLQLAPLPCILHWKGDHFVVLEGIRGQTVQINDPAMGRRRISMEELREAYSGVILSFLPGDRFQKIRPQAVILRSMKTSLGVFRRGWLFLAVSGMLLVLPSLFTPILTRMFMDQVVMGSFGDTLGPVLIGLGVVTVCQMGLNHIRNAVLSRIKLMQTMDSKYELLRKMLRLPIPFFEQRYAGELAQREEAVARIYDFIDGNLADIAQHLFEMVFFLLLMFLYSPMLTGVSLLVAVITVAFVGWVTRRLSDLAMKQNQDRNRLMGIFVAGLSVFSTVKASGCENEYLTSVMDHYTETAVSEMRLTRSSQILSAMPQTLFQMVNVTVLMLGSLLVTRGSMTIGMMTAFCQVLGSFLAPVSQLLSMARQLQTVKADIAILDDVHSAKDDEAFRHVPDPDGPADLEGRLEARHVTFGYIRNEPVVRDFSIRMTPGSRIGIVGASGSGKSTAGKLLAGILTPWSGDVLVDGIRMSDLNELVRSTSIAMVSQKETFFSATIRENLTLWNAKISDENLFWALSDADAVDLVNALPGGMEYMIEEGGANFSGGQLQQLALARALVKNPAVLVLDEATSAMDPQRERKIMENVRCRSCTCIVIAHRLTTVRGCDLILVMQNGAVVEWGSHDQLMARDGLYAALYAGKKA